MAELKPINKVKTSDSTLRAIATNIQILYENQVKINNELSK